MSNINETTKEQVSAPAVRTTSTKASKREVGQKPKVTKPAAPDGETTDRLPATLRELKETKGGLVATLFLGGTDKDGIARELKAAFKLSEAQALKVTRRITGRVRLYQRIFELVPVKK